MTVLDQVRQTFTLERLPANIRISKLLGSLPILRRCSALPTRIRLIPAEGSFYYRTKQDSKKVLFNGRNLQFHALYDVQYKYGYELETACLLATLCKGNRPLFDIGANWGYFSLLAAALPAFSGSIFAFEPNPRTFADLMRTIEQAGVAGRVHPSNIGLGRSACEMVVDEIDSWNTGLSRLANAGAGTRVAVKPIDMLEFGAPGTIKIDAEGMELDILSGASNTLSNAKPYLVFENFLDYRAPQRTYDVFDFLLAHNYSVFVPVLRFSIAGSPVVSTYGQDFTLLADQDPNPQIGAVEVSRDRRFLFNDQLNLLGVPSDRIGDLWSAGVLNMGQI